MNPTQTNFWIIWLIVNWEKVKFRKIYLLYQRAVVRKNSDFQRKRMQSHKMILKQYEPNRQKHYKMLEIINRKIRQLAGTLILLHIYNKYN